MSSNPKNIQRELLKDFILTYQNQPCLWNVKSKEYHDKAMRDAAYDILLQKYKLIDPEAKKNTVVNKIYSFRRCYRKEKKIIEQSHKSGVDPDEMHKPVLWYYNMFHFLDDQDTPVNSLCDLNNDHSLETIEHNNQKSEDVYDALERNTTSKTIPERSNEQINVECDSLLETIEHRSKKSKLQEDRYDALGKNVAFRMRDISDNYQRIIAEKVIHDALFMAETGQLSLS